MTTHANTPHLTETSFLEHGHETHEAIARGVWRYGVSLDNRGTVCPGMLDCGCNDFLGDPLPPKSPYYEKTRNRPNTFVRAVFVDEASIC
jgi:hypothetical protein